jgi:hypothetical protein
VASGWRASSSCSASSSSRPKAATTPAFVLTYRLAKPETKNQADDRPVTCQVYDPNLSNIPPGHPFLPGQQLEAQSLQLLEFLLRTLYSSADSTLLTALLSLLPPIVRLRPTLAAVLIPALTGWTPSAVEKAGKDRGDVRATEKLVRALMYGFERSVFDPSTHRRGWLTPAAAPSRCSSLAGQAQSPHPLSPNCSRLS